MASDTQIVNTKAESLGILIARAVLALRREHCPWRRWIAPQPGWALLIFQVPPDGFVGEAHAPAAEPDGVAHQFLAAPVIGGAVDVGRKDIEEGADMFGEQRGVLHRDLPAVYVARLASVLQGHGNAVVHQSLGATIDQGGKAGVPDETCQQEAEAL